MILLNYFVVSDLYYHNLVHLYVYGGIAKRKGKGLQNLDPRFKSGCHLKGVSLCMSIEEQLRQYNNVKIELLKTSKCLMNCSSNFERENYQNRCLEYAKELKKMQLEVENNYGLKLCMCLDVNDKRGD